MVETPRGILKALRDIAEAINNVAEALSNFGERADSLLNNLDVLSHNLMEFSGYLKILSILIGVLIVVLVLLLLIIFAIWFIPKMARLLNGVFRAVWRGGHSIMGVGKRVGHDAVQGSMQIAQTAVSKTVSGGKAIGSGSEKVWTAMKPGLETTGSIIREQSTKTAKVSKRAAQVSSQWASVNVPKAKEALKQASQQAMEVTKRSSKVAGKVLANGSTNAVAAVKQGGEVGAKVIADGSKQAAGVTREAAGVVASWTKDKTPKVQAKVMAVTKKGGELLKGLSFKVRNSINGLRARKGFTLVELMAVVAIVALLAMIALPSASRARQNAEDAKTEKELGSIYQAIVMFQVNNGFRLPMSWDELRPYIEIDEDKYQLSPT